MGINLPLFLKLSPRIPMPAPIVFSSAPTHGLFKRSPAPMPAEYESPIAAIDVIEVKCDKPRL